MKSHTHKTRRLPMKHLIEQGHLKTQAKKHGPDQPHLTFEPKSAMGNYHKNSRGNPRSLFTGFLAYASLT